ncbi:acyltransferase family protein [Phyllobacterium myrsinacearum]|uniref:Acyltransferase n=1 Tax=Phyllobacterium myrsinacearum TaxID=28101 RepID=A0A2S9JDJ3_9HYPH|nr:acyltransferase [Phyllobacterium myrsinacearum]PRD50961.1 acyltransferase [Phyllobacterium myrsinacearum]PWV88339.1 peptidoglycan/LPS O-acetylase OafA/YrhL [Phyllobacterium myrsinacearum]RZU97630.1 peptidoglycan/LPS O-acetylase OafA/YrhL [Phyllobacterium myrsinacearum]
MTHLRDSSLPGRQPHSDGIDLLRGLSVVWVILFHLQLRMPFETTPLGARLPPEIFNAVLRSGYYGVVIFFAISGFLITTTSLRRWGRLDTINPVDFYVLRLTRIWPCLIALLAVLCLLHLLAADGFVVTTVPLYRALLAALSFHVNWLEAATGYLPGSWDILWSLAVEEMFYFVFPLLCLIARTPGRLVAMLCVFVVLGPLARTVLTDNDLWADKSYLSGVDAIALGCIAALVSQRVRDRPALRGACLAAGVLLFALIFVFRRQTSELGLTALGLNVTALALAVCLMLIALQDRRLAFGACALAVTAPIRWFGRNSYEVYLSHMLVITPLASLAPAAGSDTVPALMFFLAGLVLSGITGDLIARFYSAPLNAGLRSLYGQRPG